MEDPKHLQAGLYEAVVTFRRVEQEECLLPETTLRLRVVLPPAQQGPIFQARANLWRNLARFMTDHADLHDALRAEQPAGLNTRKLEGS